MVLLLLPESFKNTVASKVVLFDLSKKYCCVILTLLFQKYCCALHKMNKFNAYNIEKYIYFVLFLLVLNS